MPRQLCLLLLLLLLVKAWWSVRRPTHFTYSNVLAHATCVAGKEVVGFIDSNEASHGP
jgi:hypothetical protein